MEEKEIKREHTLNIGNKITVTGVKSVLSADEKEVRILLDGKTLTLSGSGFAAEKLSVEEGVFVLGGKVASARYGNLKSTAGVLKKLFG